jgi:hypothetical protein
MALCKNKSNFASLLMSLPLSTKVTSMTPWINRRFLREPFQFQLLGPKDRQLVAPSVRAGRFDASYLSAEGAPQFVPALSGLATIEKIEFPALTDGATNCRSFGPVLKRNQHLFLRVTLPIWLTA